MTGLEAIPAVNALFINLFERIKDRQTATLVGQVQSLFQTIQTAFFAAEHKALETATQNFNLARQIAQMEDKHTKTMAALQDSNAQAMAALRKSQSDQITQLVTKHQLEVARLNKRIADMTPKRTAPRVQKILQRAMPAPVGHTLPASPRKQRS